VDCQVSVEKVKGHSHQTSKTSRNCCISSVHVYLRTADPALAAQAPTVTMPRQLDRHPRIMSPACDVCNYLLNTGEEMHIGL